MLCGAWEELFPSAAGNPAANFGNDGLWSMELGSSDTSISVLTRTVNEKE